MIFVEYARRRKMGYSITASISFAQQSEAGDKAVAVAVAVFFVWILADSLLALF